MLQTAAHVQHIAVDVANCIVNDQCATAGCDCRGAHTSASSKQCDQLSQAAVLHRQAVAQYILVLAALELAVHRAQSTQHSCEQALV
jgi:hypothetical protein